MAKRSFTTRLDDHVLALAQQIAQAERRSVTSVIEMAVLEYGKQQGIGRVAAATEAPAPTTEDTMRKIAERRSAAAQGRKSAERAIKRASAKPIAE